MDKFLSLTDQIKQIYNEMLISIPSYFEQYILPHKDFLLTWISIVLFLMVTGALIRGYIDRSNPYSEQTLNAFKKTSFTIFIILLPAVIIINPVSIQYGVNWYIQKLNEAYSAQFKNIKYDVNIKSIILYIILVTGSFISSYVAYLTECKATQAFINRKKREALKENNDEIWEYEEGKDNKTKKIIFPAPIEPESPHLKERVKELFEIKYLNYGLKLKQPANHDNILYGSYKDDFNQFFDIIYCDDRKDIDVSIGEQEQIYEYLQNSIINKLHSKYYNGFQKQDNEKESRRSLLKQKLSELKRENILTPDVQMKFNLKHKILDVEKELQQLEKELSQTEITEESNKRNVVIRCYYILTSGSFKPHPKLSRLKCQTEDEFCASLINFTNYLRELQYDFQHSKLFSAITKEEDKKTLSQTFVAPSFSIDDKTEQNEGLKDYIDNWLTNTSDNKHLVLLGDYGMGKTSFLKYYAATLAKDILEGKQLKRFPVFISLTNTSPIHGGITKLVEAFVARRLGANYSLFEKLICKGKILFLLDAFDEMGYIGTHEQRFKQFNEIWQLAVRNNKMLLSGRPSYFPTEFELNQTLNIPPKGDECIQVRPYSQKITLTPLGNESILKYISHYYPQNARVYMRWIMKNPSIHDLCRRPSMMHIIREMLPTLLKESPNKILNAREMMERYINFWYERQKDKKIVSAIISKEFVFQFFNELAAYFYRRNILQVDSKIVLHMLQEKIEQNEDIQEMLEREEYLEGFESEILSAYFIEIEDDEYKFVHKSFYEYFTASTIIRLIQQKDFDNEFFDKPLSPEIIDYVYDYIPENYRNNPRLPSVLLLFMENDKFLANSIQFSNSVRWLLNCAIDSFTRLGVYGSVSLLGAMLIFIVIMIIIYMIYSVGLCFPYILNSLASIGSFFLGLFFAAFFFLMLIFPLSIVFIPMFIWEESFEDKVKGILPLVENAYKISFMKGQLNYKNVGEDILFLLYEKLAQEEIFPKIIENCTFKNIIIPSCDMKRVVFRNVKFIRSIITTDFYNVNFETVIFEKCIFADTSSFDGLLSFDGCHFNSVQFEKCILCGDITFTSCDFQEVQFNRIKYITWLQNVIAFEEMKSSQIDDYTMNYLGSLIRKKGFEIDKRIVVEPWLAEKLKDFPKFILPEE